MGVRMDYTRKALGRERTVRSALRRPNKGGDYTQSTRTVLVGQVVPVQVRFGEDRVMSCATFTVLSANSEQKRIWRRALARSGGRVTVVGTVGETENHRNPVLTSYSVSAERHQLATLALCGVVRDITYTAARVYQCAGAGERPRRAPELVTPEPIPVPTVADDKRLNSDKVPAGRNGIALPSGRVI